MKKSLRKGLFLAAIAISFIIGCKQEKTKVADSTFKKDFAAKLKKLSRNGDSLKIVLQDQMNSKNDVGIMLAYRQLGKHQRENALFSEAIAFHEKALDYAKKINDTIEIVQCYNDLGTNLRRIGALAEAGNYHYQALQIADAFSDRDNTGKKARVSALNGIGNVSMQLDYYDDAEKYFREALKEEIQLKSDIGQAINYANLGSIFRKRQQFDSAQVYYEKSLERNIAGKSKLGVGLCYIHLGNVYKDKGDYQNALAEFERAYQQMENYSDKWYWLSACISVANIYLILNKEAEFYDYITRAEEVALNIKSPRHLEEIYDLKHDYFVRKKEYKQALGFYKLSRNTQDSVKGKENADHYMNLRLNYEREQNNRQLQKIENENKIKEENKQRTIYIALLVIFISLLFLGVLYYAYRQRTRSNKILKEIERARSDFFTNITHEFRTPLTVIQGLNRQLELHNFLSEKERIKFHRAIDRQSENLLKLVNQLLDIAKLRGGNEKPSWQRGDIISYLRMSAETYQLYAREKNVNLIFYTDITAQEMDFVPFYMDKIISNLLSNAIKHTDNGDKIDFIISKGQNQQTIVIQVADNGEGIPKNELERIFELFYQSPNAKNLSGTGIGLAFTKMLVEKMNGKIEVESQIGEGSTFKVTLPLKNKNVQTIPILENKNTDLHTFEIPSENEIQQEKQEDIANSEKPLILVVEDNKDISIYIKSILSQYNVILAKNGKEGFEMAEKHIPDLVITDVMMPLKNGYELCKDMKESLLVNHIPIIMLTAKTSDNDLMQGLSYGIEAYIKKPFSTEELLLRIEKILENRKILKEKYLTTLKNNSTDQKLQTDDNVKFLQRVMNIVESEMGNTDLNPAYVAEKLAMSPAQLGRKLNQITGMPTISYILQIRLLKAKRILENDPLMSLSEVSSTCGFYDLSHFSKIFKKEYGVSPSQYKRINN